MTIYGIVDGGYGSLATTTIAGAKTTAKGVHSMQSTSRIGFKGTEDLGGGLKANFTLEYAIEPDNGSVIGGNLTGNSARQAFVGLSGGFGDVSVGNITTLMALGNGAADFNGGTAVSGYLPGMMNQSNRRANTIQYTTPTIQGFSAVLATSPKGNVDGTKTGDASAFQLKYANGPLSASYTSETSKLTAFAVGFGTPGIADFGNLTRTKTTFSNATGDLDRAALSAAYDFGVAKVAYTRSTAEAGTTTAVSGLTTAKLTTDNYGVSVPMGAMTLNASISNGKITAAGGSAPDDMKLSAYQVGAYYALSKRTNLYAIVGQAKDKSSSAKDSMSAIGVRHQF